MRIPVVLFLALICLPTRAFAADLDVNWTPVAEAPSDDRTLAQKVLAESLEGMEEDGPNWRRGKAMVASIPIAEGRDLFLVEMPATGNCGEIELTVFGPRQARNVRSLLLQSGCFNDLRFRQYPGKEMPDIVTAIGDLADRLFRWNGRTWDADEVIESAAMSHAVEGDAGDLSRFAGTYELLPALRLRQFRDQLIRGLMGYYPTLLANLSVRGPLVYENGCLVAQGLAPHQGGSEEAVVAMCSDGRVQAALWSGRRYVLFPRRAGMSDLAVSVRDFLHRRPTAEIVRVGP